MRCDPIHPPNLSENLLMGVSWITEMVTLAVDLPFEVTVVTDVLNMLTGVHVFIIYVFKSSVWYLLEREFPFPIELYRYLFELQILKTKFLAKSKYPLKQDIRL